MVFDNKKTQVFLKLFLVHIIHFINIYGPKKIRDNTATYGRPFF